MSQDNSIINKLPESLREPVERYWATYREAADAARVRIPSQPDFLKVLFHVWSLSDFVARSCTQDPQLLADLQTSGDLLVDYRSEEYVYRCHAALAGVRDEEELTETVRHIRAYEMVRIAWRDLAGWADLDQTMSDLSHLAEACIDAALHKLYAWRCKVQGAPHDADGRPQQLVVLGMGKLGARELNFSSDIDLIFAFPEHGETRGRRPRISNEEFFTRLGQDLIRALDAVTADGFVFRVDMRLRPFGDSGPLVASFDALEEYYQTHGRAWERYALIKARVVAGDRAAGAQLLERLRPFVYRRYIDFGAFDSLREMKAMIMRQVERKGLEDNIKVGAGGIREVEFIGQAFQLIRGGREPLLQTRAIQPVLQRLAELEYLPRFVTQELLAAYVFLRNTEHRLQEYADEQTHTLPHLPADRLRLARGMGFAHWDEFAAVVSDHRERVHALFDQILAAPQAGHAEVDEFDLKGIWLGTLDSEKAADVLRQLGYADPEQAIHVLTQLRASYACRALTPRGRERIDQLMPLVLGAAAITDNSSENLRRVAALIEAVARRTAYLALLVENPVALSQLVRLCGASPWIAGQLAEHPILLDELLDPRNLYVASDRARLRAELTDRLVHVPHDDLEQQMETLRYFKHANLLRVAAVDVTGKLPLMIVSDHLTDIAETILNAVLELAWEYMLERHGRPSCTRQGRTGDIGFAIVAYGKLGGIELGYGSDLDLVFLHAADGEGLSDGPRPLENAVFYARLAQRIIHMLTTFTPSGVLYEVDMRLRPSGAAGLLVSSLSAFAEYQRTDAWTWEHQALVRARVVAGDAALGEAFDAIRREVLSRTRETAGLRKEVRDMRARMRQEQASREDDVFDIKRDAGGITDIEFVVQYNVLRWACQYAELLDWTDNIRLLETLARFELLPHDDVRLLADAYRAYRAAVHRLALQDAPARVSPDEFREYQDGVMRIWARELEAAQE